MFLPVWTTTPVRQIPLLLTALVALNVLIFVLAGDDLEQVNGRLGFHGPDSAADLVRTPARCTQLVTYMFVHSSWEHLAANMAFLICFGAPTELRLGSVRFAAVYLASGVLPALVQAAVAGVVGSDGLCIYIGSSAAVSGVTACYLALHPLDCVYGVVLFGAAFVPLIIPNTLLFALWLLVHVGGMHQQLLAPLTNGQTVWSWHLMSFAFGMVIAHRIERRVGYR